MAAGRPLDVELNDRGLRISPLDDATLAEVNVLRPQAYDLMPRVKITDLLLEVHQWTDFTRHFTHLKNEAKAPERTLLLTAILADVFNLGLEKVADTCAGTSAAKLAWLVAWYIRDETHQNGSEELVNYLHDLPFTTYWGAGTTAPPLTTTSFPSSILVRTSWRTTSLRWNQMTLRSARTVVHQSRSFGRVSCPYRNSSEANCAYRRCVETQVHRPRRRCWTHGDLIYRNFAGGAHSRHPSRFLST